MMGYTHTVVGAAGALTTAAIIGNETPELYMIAVISGALGGVTIDIDVRDNFKNSKVTDAGRTRLAVLCLIGLGFLLDYIFKFGWLHSIVLKQYYALGGVVVFIVVMLIGFFSKHRTFSHSLLFVILSAIGVYFVLPKATLYYSVGCILHLMLDMLNYPFHGHGVWLFYPIKTGNGIALGWCKAGRSANKVFYFIGLALFLAATAYYVYLIRNLKNVICPMIIAVYMVVVMHFVRVKSEKEQRHIMHMHGEL